MRILMRNTVFKTVALAGLFLCMLVFGGAFSGITTSAHAVHAEDVDTQDELEQFVTEAVDEYYIEFLLKEHCDLRNLNLPPALANAIPTFLPLAGLSVSITDLSPDSIRMLPIEDVRKLIGLFNSPTVQGLLAGVDLDIWGTCDFPPTSTFREVFASDESEADWLSGSIYLFVMNDEKELLFHGADPSVENTVLEAIDEGDRDVGQLIVDEADDPMNNGIVKYCWDDPAVDSDDIAEAENDSTIAPGDSLKVSYVIDPFSSLGVPGPSDSPGIILGSGIYPGPDPEEFPECDGNGMADGGGGMEPMEPTEPMEPPMEPTEPMEPPMEPEMPTSVSGGGCAIAGGGDSTPRNNALNLLLMVSTLFLAVSFGNRAAGRRNAIRS